MEAGGRHKIRGGGLRVGRGLGKNDVTDFSREGGREGALEAGEEGPTTEGPKGDGWGQPYALGRA